MHDALIFLLCTAAALCLAWLTTRNCLPDKPVWPLRIYRFLFTTSNASFLRQVADRKTFSRREQFMASFFIWFFVLFMCAVFAFGCGRKGC